MASPGGEKPYRLYRGGRVKGRVPSRRAGPRRHRRGRKPERDGKQPLPRARARSRPLGSPRKIRWGRELDDRARPDRPLLHRLGRARLPRLPQRRLRREQAAAADRQGARSRRTRAACSRTRRSILLLGTDHSLAASRSGDRHSDSITLLRTDPRPRPALLPLDPARPARRDPRLRRARRSTPPSRSAARGSRRARSPPTPTSRSTTSWSSTSPSSRT